MRNWGLLEGSCDVVFCLPLSIGGFWRVLVMSFLFEIVIEGLLEGRRICVINYVITLDTFTRTVNVDRVITMMR